MSTWTGIDVGEFSLHEVQNSYDPWFFLPKDRVREINQDGSGKVIPDGSFIGYRATVGQIRRRMALQGYDMATLETHFTEQLDIAVASLQSQLDEALPLRESELYYMHITPSLEKMRDAITGTTLSDWRDLFRTAEAWPLGGYGVFTWRETETPLLSAMVSSPFVDLPYRADGGYNFPCSDEYFYDLAVLSLFSDDTLCVLDITELVLNEYVEDFHDLEEISASATRPCRSVMASLDDFKSLSDSAPQNLVMQRMCYSSIITALEAYLSDIMKRAVKEDSVRRRFVERYKPFQKDTKLDLSSLFITLDKIDRLIADALDSILYHDLEKVRGIFKDVLLVSFPEKDRSFLNRAVQQRHDIVHRNGKTTTGKDVSVAHQDVGQLDKVVRDFIASVDGQILDGLRLPDTENTHG
ncbi:HEPN/Toprim-associated domain-containing protein (plasmid) [Kosakonia sp. ML.JS2a]|uniref:HEPN/Toprim-associated domain-containing protein n=1 Tax=Kosakonia sp. ML.JS2a TaxID=2980557 RepID=UPI0021DA92A8|nr:HEPN/Toprim-associated domain-containing protein [Kosakonia sp. ML.JS2a]UXY13493.1 HEPN/Toprim-associated domain-containing protein [Kosakonia sp. ML.JS2a]